MFTLLVTVRNSVSKILIISTMPNRRNFPTELTTILLFQSFVRPPHVRITEVVMLMNLEDIFVLVYKKFQALVVKVRNKLHIYLIPWVHNLKSYIRLKIFHSLVNIFLILRSWVTKDVCLWW